MQTTSCYSHASHNEHLLRVFFCKSSFYKYRRFHRCQISVPGLNPIQVHMWRVYLLTFKLLIFDLLCLCWFLQNVIHSTYVCETRTASLINLLMQKRFWGCGRTLTFTRFWIITLGYNFQSQVRCSFLKGICKTETKRLK